MVGQFFTSNASNAKVILGFYQVRLRKNSQLAVSVLYLLEGDMIQTYEYHYEILCGFSEVVIHFLIL